MLLLLTDTKLICGLFTMFKLLYVAVPSKAPQLTAVEVLNSTSIQVKWEPVPKEYRHGIITKYVILYTDEKGENKGEMNVSPSSETAVVNGLKQSTTYSFRVLAATVKGNGPESDPISETTKGEVIK